MEILLIILGAAAVLFIPVGSIFGFLAYQKLNKQAGRLDSLSLEVISLRQLIKRNESLMKAVSEAEPIEAELPTAEVEALNTASHSMPETAVEPALQAQAEPAVSTTATSSSTMSPEPPTFAAAPADFTPAAPSRFMQSLKENWMVWLGGLSVALAGIFMVHYSVSEGLLGPVLQLLLALSVGGVLHGAAEYLRRHTGRSDQIFAALAGGGSVTLYAALLAGIHHYQLIGSLLGLVLLAAVSLGTMFLARLYGPLLAFMGLSGAYIVPLLIGSDTGSVAFVLTYSWLITLSSLLLMRSSFHLGLWYATLAGALLWWLAALFTPADLAPSLGFEIPLYLAALLASLLLLSESYLVGAGPLRAAVLSLLVAWGLSIFGQAIASQPQTEPLFWRWLLIWPVVLWLPSLKIPSLASVAAWASPNANQQTSLWYLPWAAVLASALGWLAYGAHASLEFMAWRPLPVEYHFGVIGYLLLSALLCMAFGVWQWRQHTAQRRWASFTLLSPLVWLLLAWLLVQGVEPALPWALTTLLAAILYGVLAKFLHGNSHLKTGAVWAMLASHIGYSLAVTMALREASLTLALAVQLVSLAWLSRRFAMPELYLLLKVVLAVVVARLTFNPWLVDYGSSNDQLNQSLSLWSWVLWTYGGATLLTTLAARLAERTHAIRPWLEAASLHLLVLFLGAELRYWLYDGDVFSLHYSFVEATINTLLWGGLSMSYLLRGRAAQQLAWLYRSGALVLLGLACCSYVLLVTWYNPWWGETEISSRPIFNMLLLAYGGPVVLALLFSRLPQLLPRVAAFKLWALATAGGAFMLFSALEIRQLWRGSDMALWSGMESGELYSYSVVGMLYAIAAIIYATKKAYPLIYKAGMVLLGLVIAKIFLIDMDGLEGLWRVAAFMGLGLSLLGLAWMHQKVQRAVGLVKGEGSA